MGNQQQKAFQENFQNQLKWGRRNRKTDGRTGKKDDLAMTPQEVEDVWHQIAYEYPFFGSVADSAIMTSHTLPDEPIVYANDEFCELTGYPKEEILGRNCRFLQGKYTDPKAVQSIRDALKTGSRLELELLNYRKDGTPFLNGFCMLPLHESGKKEGKVMYFLAIQKNVTVIVAPWRAPMNKWTVPEVCMWLDKNGGGSYVKGFLAKDISGAFLESLSVQQMQECGIVLSNEQTRITRLIQNEKALRFARGEEFQTADLNSSVLDDESTVAKRKPSRGGDDLSQLTDKNTEDDDEDLPRLKGKNASSGGGGGGGGGSGSSRKTSVSLRFKKDARPPVSIIVSSASTSHTELRRVLRKKTGRKYEMQTMNAPAGLVSGLCIEVEPSTEGLEATHFSVLDGINDPVIVTDNVGMIVFANDRAWEAFHFASDPVDTYILSLLKCATLSKMDYVSDLRSNRLAVTVAEKSSWIANFNQVPLGNKCKVHVWSFIATEERL